MAKETSRVVWFLWPFWALWKLLLLVIQLTGRVVAAVLALALMIVGFVASLTVVGAVVGVPLMVVGFLLLWRAIF